jgi:hypothetical protein
MLFKKLEIDLKEKYKNRPEWQRPEIWSLVCDPDRASQRQLVEKTLSRFSNDEVDKFIGRLCDNSRFYSTYLEICVASNFKDDGLTVEYEPELDNLTPDFLLKTDSGRPLAIVEVVTKFRPDYKRKIEKRWFTLKKMIDQIPIPVAIAICPSVKRPVKPPKDEKEAKRISREVETWLRNLVLTPGENSFKIRGYEFIVADNLPGSKAKFMPPGGGTWIDSDMILNIIRMKVHKYATICRLKGTPLIVVISKEAEVPLWKEHVEQALAGIQVVAFTIDRFSSSAGSHTVAMRQENELKVFDQCLSAVGFLKPGINDSGQLTLFPVDSAKNKSIASAIFK